VTLFETWKKLSGVGAELQDVFLTQALMQNFCVLVKLGYIAEIVVLFGVELELNATPSSSK
jgi:hypothetical protein